MNKQERMYEQIREHGENLKAVFNLPAEIDGVKLCKQLLRIEREAHQYMLDFCNGEISPSDEDVARFEAAILNRVDKLIHAQGMPVFVNQDPRGYALKIDDQYVRENQLRIYRDMGGYGILAPTFTGDN